MSNWAFSSSNKNTSKNNIRKNEKKRAVRNENRKIYEQTLNENSQEDVSSFVPASIQEDVSSFVPACNQENPPIFIANHNQEDVSSFVPASNVDMIKDKENYESDTASHLNEYLNDDFSSESNYSDSDSINDHLEHFMNKYDMHEREIYAQSNIKYKHFVAIYIKEFVDLDLSNDIHNKILKFLRVILPSDGLNIPKTYNALVKSYKLPNVINKKLCAKCSRELEKDEDCQVVTCMHFKNTRENRGKKDPNLIEFNINEQIQSMIPKHWQSILDYRHVLSLNKVSDICNSKLYNSYNLDTNTISLLLFIDGAPFSKSDKGSV
jgi:thiol-disulfide isomerase/thioredoxin